jgi:hypothetical protein
VYSYRTDGAAPEPALPLTCLQRLASVHAWAAARRDARREPAGEAAKRRLLARTRKDLVFLVDVLVAGGVVVAVFDGFRDV